MTLLDGVVCASPRCSSVFHKGCVMGKEVFGVQAKPVEDCVNAFIRKKSRGGDAASLLCRCGRMHYNALVSWQALTSPPSISHLIWAHSLHGPALIHLCFRGGLCIDQCPVRSLCTSFVSEVPLPLYRITAMAVLHR